MIAAQGLAKLPYLRLVTIWNADPSPKSILSQHKDKTGYFVCDGFFVFELGDAFRAAVRTEPILPRDNADIGLAGSNIFQAVVQRALVGCAVIFHSNRKMPQIADGISTRTALRLKISKRRRYIHSCHLRLRTCRGKKPGECSRWMPVLKFTRY